MISGTTSYGLALFENVTDDTVFVMKGTNPYISASQQKAE